MKGLQNLTTVILASLTLLFLGAGALGIATFTGDLRFVSATDSANSPQVFKGSLVVLKKESPKDLEKGDMILVGAKGNAGSTLGEIISINDSSKGSSTATLKASNRLVPDNWDYDLGNKTYKMLFSIPLIGFAVTLTAGLISPWVFALLMGIIASSIIFIVRKQFFAPYEKKIVEEIEIQEDGPDAVDEVIALFTEAGLNSPLLEKKRKKDVG